MERACLVMRAPIARYPSSVYQAEILSEHGTKVTLLDCEDGGYHATELPININRCIVGKTDYAWQGTAPWFSPFRRWRFKRNVRRRIIELDPELTIAYEPPAMSMLPRSRNTHSNRHRVVWHFHEFPDLHRSQGPGTRSDIKFVRDNVTMADLLVFPDQQRAELFATEVGLNELPSVVMNCPRLLETIPKSTLARRLNHDSSSFAHIILYNGSIGQGHGIELAVESMKFWPKESVFALVGPCSKTYRDRILAQATALSLARRVVFLGTIDPKEIWSVRAGADLALTIMVPVGRSSINYRYAAGASNKRFEAMAVGIAQITNKGPGIADIIEKVGCGISVSTESPHELGEAVAYLLGNETSRRKMGESGRQAHLAEFNYELQFAPVLEKIINVCDAN